MPWHILKGISQFLHTLSYSYQPYWPKVFHNTLIHIHNPASQTGQRPWVMYNTPSNTPSLCSNTHGLSPGYTYGISTLHDTRSAPVHYSLPQRSTNDTNTPCIFVHIPTVLTCVSHIIMSIYLLRCCPASREMLPGSR